ncbi:MAG: hypothetical protein NTW06_03870, partial [Candidatus Falkowbacteria bacterium]|nr:hypothetical protein [Candidatus Falkowbacteria bacterium]
VAPTCTAFTYIDWTTCSANGSQSRKVASSSPAGCIGGNPILTQICTFIPTCQSTCDPATYTNQCNATGISGYTECSKKLDGCYYPVGKLCPPGQPCSEGKCVAPTCTNFTYTVWAACNSDSSQLRKVVISLPLGCTGGNPVLTQKCTYVPPVPTCTDFTYSDWTACSILGLQTRKVTSSSSTGCTGGNPVLTQKCTYVPSCQSTCDPAAYGTQCTAARANGYTECSKKLDGCYSPAEKLCPLGQTCSDGKCSVPCLAQGRNSSNLLAACCEGLAKKTDYYLNINYLYTCCLPTQCAKNGVCVDNGSTIPVAGSTIVPTCVDGEWVRKAIS